MRTEVAILHRGYPSTIRDYVEKKLEHLVRHYDRTVSVRATLERQREVHRAELVVNVGGGVVLVVDARSDAIRSAFDDSVARMTRVLARHKQKMTNGTRRKSRARL